MPITPTSPFPKQRGDTVRSADWNQTVNEVIRLDQAKVNRAGDTITGPLAVNSGLGSNGPVTLNGVNSRLQITQTAAANESLTGATITLSGTGTGFHQGLSVNAASAGGTRGLTVSAQCSSNQNALAALILSSGGGGGFREGMQINVGGDGGARGLTVQSNAGGDQSAEGVTIFTSGAGKGGRTALNVMANNTSAGGPTTGAVLSAFTAADSDTATGLNVTASGDGKAGRTGLSINAYTGANGASVLGASIFTTMGANGGTGLQVYSQATGAGFISAVNVIAVGDGSAQRTALAVSADGGANGGNANASTFQATTPGAGVARAVSVNAFGNGAGPRFGLTINASGGTGVTSAYGAQINTVVQDGSNAYGLLVTASGSGAGQRYAILASASGGVPANTFAGYFNGNVYVNGNLGKASGSFLIDHPNDPKNKTLRHNLVESPEHLCIYRGSVTLDEKGRASVDLPRYFAGLTDEVSATVYLTPVGTTPFGTSYSWNRKHTAFTVYGEAGADVAYMVLADRDDPVAAHLRQPIEETKGPNGVVDKGQYLNPEAYEVALEKGAAFVSEEEFDIKAAPPEPVVVPDEPPSIPEPPDAPKIKAIKPIRPPEPPRA